MLNTSWLASRSLTETLTGVPRIRSRSTASGNVAAVVLGRELLRRLFACAHDLGIDRMTNKVFVSDLAVSDLLADSGCVHWLATHGVVVNAEFELAQILHA